MEDIRITYPEQQLSESKVAKRESSAEDSNRQLAGWLVGRVCFTSRGEDDVHPSTKVREIPINKRTSFF
jgi:hypothetical protein